jgi:hypothetical protein
MVNYGDQKRQPSICSIISVILEKWGNRKMVKILNVARIEGYYYIEKLSLQIRTPR